MSRRANKSGRARGRHPRARKRRSGWKRLLPTWWIVAAAGAALVVVLAVVFTLGGVLLPEAFAPSQSTKILASDGKLIDTLHGEEDRTLVPLDQISVSLREAVVATEDRNFYEHQGVSLRAIFRAVFTNVRRGEVAQGGSTITQQYVRNRYEEVGRERTIFRKIREAVMAVKVERRYSKPKILEFYLNTVYFGRGAYGAEAAAMTYFKKQAKDLTVSEAAYLAGVIRAPQLHQPDTQPERAESVRKKVIRDMVNAGYLEEEEAKQAEQDVPKFSLGRSGAAGASGGRAAFFVEYVRRQLLSEFKISERDVLTGGLIVHTTLDLRMQAAAEKAISSTLDKPEDPEAALVAMEPSGELRAMVGGRDFTNVERARGFNFAIQKGGKTGGRQAGSAFKPFTLAAFIDEGYSPNSKFLGPSKITIPSAQCKDEKGKSWEVSNFDSASFGETTVVDATVSSVNTVYAQMVDLVKARKVRDIAEKAGPWDLKAVCSLSLGTAVVTPLEMSQAFATFAAHGRR
ncbi:MAG: transglycosylase domain-containing protein, partial [Acidimicrobiia bacterium]